MKTGDLAKQFGVSQTTITRWIDNFDEFFSKGAQKIGTKQRVYTEDDILVLATIAKLSVDGYSQAEIRSRLDEGERVEHPGVANFGIDTRMIPAAAVEQVIDSTEVRIELEQVRAERDKLIEILTETQEEMRMLRTRLEGVEVERRDEIQRWENQRREELAMLQKQISELQHQLGRAEGELAYRRELDQERRKKPNDDD